MCRFVSLIVSDRHLSMDPSIQPASQYAGGVWRLNVYLYFGIAPVLFFYLVVGELNNVVQCLNTDNTSVFISHKLCPQCYPVPT